MDGFEAREHAAEARFVLEQDRRFRDRMARVRKLGAWASRLIATRPDESARYEDALARLAISEAEDGTIVDRVRDDLEAAGLAMSEGVIGAVLSGDKP
jgi:hypothetical protein